MKALSQLRDKLRIAVHLKKKEKKRKAKNNQTSTKSRQSDC